MTAGLTVGTSGGNKAASEIYVGTASGNKQVTQGWVGTSGGNKQFFSAAGAPSVTVPDGQWVEQSGEGGKPYYLDTLTATPSGGTAPYTYQWSVVSGDATPLNETSASCEFYSEVNAQAVVKCTVTDSLSQAGDDNGTIEAAA